MNNLIYYFTTILLLCTHSFIFAQNKLDVIVENEQLRLIIGHNGIAKSLVYKNTNEECLLAQDSIPAFSVTQERPYHNEIKLSHPNKRMTFNANSVRREEDKLIIGFELVPYDAVIKITEHDNYISFTFDDFIIHPNEYPDYLKITPPPTSEICFLQLPIRNRENFGEWLNVTWDDNISINILGTDQYSRIDSETRNGYRIMKADATKDVKLREAGAALVVCETDKLLDVIEQIEIDFDLPLGVSSRRNKQTKLSYYWTANVNPGNLDQHIFYAKLGGFSNFMIYYTAVLLSNGYRNLGNYEYNTSLFPKGKDDVKKMIDKIEEEGLTPGLHVLHSHIGRDSKYITPIPDHRLNIIRHFTLAKPLSETDTEIYVEQNPLESTLADGTRVLKVGTELISYTDFTTIAPYKFTGCERGIDRTTINSQPVGYTLGLLDVSEFGATSVYIDQNTNLQDEIADKIADLYNIGFKSIYFDGSEGVNNPFWFHVASAQYKVFKRLNPQPLFAEGAAKTHFSWHMLSGGNAFDVFSPETLKDEIRKWPATEAERMKNDFTRINFGWLGYFVPSNNTVGTQPDMLEYVSSRAAAWDCPISIQSNLQLFNEHPRTADNLEVLNNWETVRKTNWLTNKQKSLLKELDQEHILILNEHEEFELLPYEQMTEVARGNQSIRAFSFDRKDNFYIVYWHTKGNGKLKLKENNFDVELFERIGTNKKHITLENGELELPLSNRHFIKTKMASKDKLIDAMMHATIEE